MSRARGGAGAHFPAPSNVSSGVIPEWSYCHVKYHARATHVAGDQREESVIRLGSSARRVAPRR